MRWALILGASGDIGSKIANDLAAQGWSLYLHYNNSYEKVKRLYNKLDSEYSKQEFLIIQSDMSKISEIDKLTNSVFSLDAVIFAEGTTKYGLFNQLKMEEFDEMLTMQLRYPLFLLQKLEEKLARSSLGRIVFIGSVYGGYGSAMEVGYSTIKGALSAFVKAYSKEVASLGITVNVVAPGAVDTRMNNMFSSDVKEQVAEDIPMGKLAQPDQISYWVTCLLADRAEYLTGQTIYVTGGWLQ